MTAVVGAGDGKLSGGHYKSLAPDAKLVLLKVADEKGHISGKHIAEAIYWAITHKEEYNIRILNLSVTDDWETSYKENEVDIAIEKAVGKGIVVVVAAGNDEDALLKAPANSPHAITVGGLDDRNTLYPLTQTIYHSTFGETVDGIHKPDLIAPAIWIPAPILPQSREQAVAKVLFSLLATENEIYFRAKFHNYSDLLGLDNQLWRKPIEVIKATVQATISKQRLISPHYQHSDGTSFAAPIVSSLVAQLLEANPKLSPVSVRVILQRSARKLKDVSAERQGFGVIHPLSATYLAEKEHRWLPDHFMPLINQLTETVEFQLNENAETVALSGDFMAWQVPGLMLTQQQENLWQISHALPPKGIYRYKYLLNNQKWIPDSANILRELDGYDGFNSKLIIE
jgi:serine protease AprX